MGNVWNILGLEEKTVFHSILFISVLLIYSRVKSPDLVVELAPLSDLCFDNKQYPSREIYS